MIRTDEVTKINELRMALKQLQEKRPEDARAVLKELVENRLDVERMPSDIVFHVFASALAKRLEKEAADEINLYLKQYEQSQIELFNLVAQHLPFVKQAGQVANRFLAEFMAGQEEVSLLNIGIGTGRQELMLLELLAERGELPRKLNVYGIEPMADGLALAEKLIAEACGRLGVELVFHAYTTVAEEMTEAEWAALVPEKGPLLVNAAFALHHIHGNEAETGARLETLRKVRTLNPVAVVLSEPNSDHYEPELEVRFENCYGHFRLVFDFIDQLNLSQAEAIALKMFFVREIEDIVGNREETRYERHERVETWVERLRRAGFDLYTTPAVLDGIVQHPSMSVQLHDDYVGFDYQNETIVGVICGVPQE